MHQKIAFSAPNTLESDYERRFMIPGCHLIEGERAGAMGDIDGADIE
jgi:hypothetical protein